jgi:putative membrane protein
LVRRLSDDDKARLHAAIADAEARTTARVACIVVPASERYLLYPLLWGAIAALMVGAAASLYTPHLSMRIGLIVQAAVFAFATLAFDWFPLRLVLVPHHAKTSYARNFAHREFAARILSPTDHREGVLLFVSLGERYVEILGTPGVHRIIGDAKWNAIVADFTRAAQEGHIAEGAIAAIETCSKDLAAHFPRTGATA